ncbi:MAG: DUF3089 domain-containing protein [Pseudomonadales bacterium]
MKAIKVLGILFAIIVVVLVGLYLSGYGQKLAGKAFVAYNTPSGQFDPALAVAPPDYSDPLFWAALPNKIDPADLVPAGIDVLAQGQQPVDTFFIHPTGYLRATSWTSPMALNSATEENTLWMMANQASAYNGCCNVYAPRYREAAIGSYFSDDVVRDEVLGFAYEDVKSAFEYYLLHFNQGRPFIIASHSQGTHHAMRLLRDVVDASELHEQLVAAYIIGAIVIPVSASWFESMSHIKACQSADDLRCVVHWDTMPEGAIGMERPEPSLCTNPLSWRVNEELAPVGLNEGAVIPEGTYNLQFGRGDDAPTRQQFESLAAPIAKHTWAQCVDGWLYVQNQIGTGFEAMGSGNLRSYHGLDYALFYMNIHNNAKHRSSRYLESADLAPGES